jgi:hypothetical protein
MALLMQRLRTLQLRLNSVDPAAVQESSERVREWRAFWGEAKARETRRRRLYAYVTGSTEAVIDDFANQFESQFLPRISESFRILKPAIECRAATIPELRVPEIEDEFAGRLHALERRSSAADVKLAELTAACTDAYQKFAEVNQRLDQIWAEERAEGVGSWRAAMRKVSEDLEVNGKTAWQSFREESLFDEGELDGPGSVGLTCPSCGYLSGRRKRRTGIKDDVLALVSIAPFWCSRCMVRFYRFRQAPRKRRSNSD